MLHEYMNTYSVQRGSQSSLIVWDLSGFECGVITGARFGGSMDFQCLETDVKNI